MTVKTRFDCSVNLVEAPRWASLQEHVGQEVSLVQQKKLPDKSGKQTNHTAEEGDPGKGITFQVNT